MNPLRIAFRADGGAALGMGHLARCRSLMREFSSRGPCSFALLSGDPGLAGAFMRSSGLEAAAYPPGGAPPGKWDILISDRPGLGTAELARLSDAAGLFAVIDDDPAFDPPCDVRVTPNLAAPDTPALRGARRASLGGGRHLILDPDYGPAAARRDDPEGPLLVSCGGSDPAGFTLSLWPVWERMAGSFPVRVVAGPAHPRKSEILARAAGVRGLSALEAPGGLLAEYLGARAAVLSGGTQLYEACALGVPAIILNQNPEQESESERAAAAGAVLVPGPAGHPDPGRVEAAARLLLTDGARRAAMGRAGRLLADAGGTRRVADAILAARGAGREKGAP